MENYFDKMQRKLFIKPYDRMIKDLVEEIKDEMIILDPDYQRNYVWNNKKASMLIESVLLNIPIPVIYASEDCEGKWIIVDGLQRLFSLKRFFDDDFKIVGLETLSNLNGCKYSTLDEPIRKKLERGELRIIVLQNDSDPNIQYDIFMRLNTGSVQLNEQELRNCLYRGSLNTMIKKIAQENSTVKKIFPFKTDRMFVNELILRYLSVSDNFDKNTNSMTNYDGRIKNLLNSFMLKHQNDEDEKLSLLKTKFETQIEKAYRIYGNLAFKKNEKTTKPNASLYECIMISFEDYSLEELNARKKAIADMTKNLLGNAEFEKSIDKATGNTEQMNRRLSKFITALGDVMKDESKG